MADNLSSKSTTSEIRQRFDNDVERFSELETGQVSTIDAPISLELITEAAKHCNPHAKYLLDIGCGAGNYTLKMLEKLPGLDCTLVDLSHPMLYRAHERVSKKTTGKIEIIQSDMRDLELPDNHFDIILAGATLHHLREDDDWENVFTKLYKTLKPGGSFWISDLVLQDAAPINEVLWNKYDNYLEAHGGADYKVHVLAYIDKEDSPRSVTYQLELMKRIGFTTTDILHKNLCFAAFGGIK